MFAVGHAVVLVTDKSQSKIFEQWYNRREILRCYRSGNWGNHHLVLREGCTHREIVFLDRCVLYCADHLRETGRGKQRDEWVGTG